MSATFEGGDIPTNFSFFSGACTDPFTLQVVLPADTLWEVTGIDIDYNMTAQAGGWKSHQRSQVFCQNTNTTEETLYEGTGNTGGIQAYSRENVDIANGIYPGGTELNFNLNTWRTAIGTGCNTTYNKVNNFTWIITVHYQAVPSDGSVGIGNTSPDSSAILELNSIQKGFLPPRMPALLRDAIPDPAEGLMVYCTDCIPHGLYVFNGALWTRSGGNRLEDGNGDTYIDVEPYPEADKIDFITAGMHVMSITPDGYVGIGTPSPWVPLSIFKQGSSHEIVNIYDTLAIPGDYTGLSINVIHPENITGNRHAAFHFMEYGGPGNLYGTRNYLSGTGTGIQEGTTNEVLGTGGGTHKGIYNYLFGNGTGVQYGTHNVITNTGGNTHEGVRNELSGIGSGDRYGTRSILSGTGTGFQYGAHHLISSTSANIHEGVRNELTGSGNGDHFGVRNILSGAGHGNQCGVHNDISNAGVGIHTGIKNVINGAQSGARFGLVNEMTSSNSSIHYAVQNTLSGTGGGDHIAIYNTLSGTGTGNQVGLNNIISNSGNGFQYGTSTAISGNGSGIHIGTVNMLSGSGTGEQTGFLTTLSGSGNGNHYGIACTMTGTGTGQKIAILGSINPSAGGTKYAGYFSGDVTVTGTFNNPSDAKLKTNIRPLKENSSLDRIKQMTIYQYEFNQKDYGFMSLPTSTQTGMIAQEVQLVFPELIKKNIHPKSSPHEEYPGMTSNPEVEYLGVDYIGLIPHLISAMQEQQKLIEELKEEIRLLKN